MHEWFTVEVLDETSSAQQGAVGDPLVAIGHGEVLTEEVRELVLVEPSTGSP